MNPNSSLSPDEPIGQGKFLSLMKRQYRDRSGTISNYEVVVRNRTNGIVAGLAVTAEEEYVLISQYRVPHGCEVFENPAGLVDAGETPEEAMRRELLEETGYSGGKLVKAFRAPTSSGLTNEVIDCFVVHGVSKRASQNLEISESIDVRLVRDAEFDDFLLRQYAR
jgi:ADP-ribose pyrophosphatase